MSYCENVYLLDLRQPQGYAHIRGEQLREQFDELKVSELLETLGTECLEIRF